MYSSYSKIAYLESKLQSHCFRLCGICSPSKHKLILATDLKKLRSIGPFYLAIIELNPKQRMGVNKSDSYIGCRRKNVKRPFGTKNVCEEADRSRILVQFFPVCPLRRTIHRLQPTKQKNPIYCKGKKSAQNFAD